MARKRRATGRGELVLADTSELEGDGATAMRDELGLFSCDYGRWQRSRSEIPPPHEGVERELVAARRR